MFVWYGLEKDEFASSFARHFIHLDVKARTELRCFSKESLSCYMHIFYKCNFDCLIWFFFVLLILKMIADFWLTRKNNTVKWSLFSGLKCLTPLHFAARLWRLLLHDFDPITAIQNINPYMQPKKSKDHWLENPWAQIYLGWPGCNWISASLLHISLAFFDDYDMNKISMPSRFFF